MKIGVLKSFDPNIVYDPSSIDKPIYIIDESIDEVYYNDITSIENLFKFLQYDFRKKLYYTKNYINEIGFNDLSEEEKKLACQYNLIEDIETQRLYFTDEEIFENLKEFNKQSKTSRIDRWEAAISYLRIYLSDINAIDMGFEMDGLNLNKNFIDYSIGSKSENGVVSGIFDYLEGTYDFENAGFPIKEYWTQEIEDGLINILKHGNY